MIKLCKIQTTIICYTDNVKTKKKHVKNCLTKSKQHY